MLEVKNMRLIDADAFIRYIDCGHLRPPTETCFSELDVVRMIDKQTTVDASPVLHAHWIRECTSIFCSACGAEYSDEIVLMNRDFNYKELKFCPECGARMDAQEDVKTE